MATLYRAQIVIKHKSALSRDNAVNNLWFYDEDAAAPDPNMLAEAVRDFYVTQRAAGWSIMALYGAQVADNGHEVRMYRHDIPTGARQPYDGAPPDHVEVFDFLGRPARPQDDALPSEVALCMSFANVGTSATPAARRRGRIFLGPLCNTAVARVAGTSRVKPQPTVIDSINQAGQWLATRMHTLLGAEAGWCVYSRPFAGRPETVRPGRSTLPELPPRAGAVYLVNQVSVDDAMDTQRRRGERATARTAVTA